MYLDKAKIFIKAGEGGNGCISFYTEKYVPDGGPDGGDGGDGGAIIFVVDPHKSNLIDFNYGKRFKAQDGAKGSSKYCHGKSGEDLTIPVPRGTLIKDASSGQIIADMFDENSRVKVLEGGLGGKGNARYKSSRRQAPRFAQSGEKTEEKAIELELKTIADVGLVGYPNVGKSTLLSVMSAARPKIANYHFTTLHPNLGMVNFYDFGFVAADIPGLIEGAADGVGLGHEFLRHIERVRLILHVVDISSVEGRDAFADYQIINKELKSYSPKLAKLPQIIVLNKSDLLSSDDGSVKEFTKRIRGKKIVKVSGATREGIDELIKLTAEKLKELPPVSPVEFEPFVYASKNKDEYMINKIDENSFELSGGLIDELARNVNMDDRESLNYFQKRLKEKDVFKRLKKHGLTDGGTIRIFDFEFDYYE